MTKPLTANPDAATCPFAEDFTAGLFRDDGPVYYKDNAEQRTGRVAFQNVVTRAGGTALELTLGADGQPPKPGTSQRAEIWERRAVIVPYGIGQWYAVSMKLADPIPHEDHRHLLMQWKGDIPPHLSPKVSPFLALRLREGQLYLTAESELLDDERGGHTAVWHRPETDQSRIWIAGGERLGRRARFLARTDQVTVIRYGHDIPSPDSGWIDWVVYAKPGPDGSGHLEIIANGQRIATVNGRIGHSHLTPGMYFKFGPYRDACEGRWTVYYDRYRRGPRLGDVWDGPVDPPFDGQPPSDF